MASSKAADPFEALANPIRRDILLYLRDEPEAPAGIIAARFPDVSRAAVSRHLGVLRSARFVRARTQGREELYALVPESLAAAHGWFAQFEAMLDGSLERLKAVVEAPEAGR